MAKIVEVKMNEINTSKGVRYQISIGDKNVTKLLKSKEECCESYLKKFLIGKEVNILTSFKNI